MSPQACSAPAAPPASKGLAGPASRRPAAIAGGLFGVGLAVAALAGTWSHRPYPAWIWLLLHAAGASFAASGTVLWVRRPGNPTGGLMVLVGATWYLADLQFCTQPVLFASGFCLCYTTFSAFVHLVLALPTGRLCGRGARVWVTVQYLLPPLVQLARYVAESPPHPEFWGAPPAVPSDLANLGSGLLVLAAVLTVSQVVLRWRRAGQPARRAYAGVWATVVGIQTAAALTAVTAGLTRVYGLPIVQQYLLVGFAVGLVVWPAGVAVGLLRVRLTALRLTDLVRRLDRPHTPAQLASALATALGDHSLRVWFPLPDSGGYVDSDGVRSDDPDGAPGHATTSVGPPGAPLALLRHDQALCEQTKFVDSVVAAARLALENARLHASLRAQLAEVQESRQRVVAAADDERRRIQRDLHDGVQHKLFAVGMLVDQARQGPNSTAGQNLALAAGYLEEAIRELRELTMGIYPAALSEQGLAAAVEQIAERAPLPVLIDISPARRPNPVERTGYFVIVEALTNTYKHAGATHVAVRVVDDDRTVTITVTDDGRGGALPARGSGLRGMRDRVEAIGGVLHVDSPAGDGTRLAVRLPCGEAQSCG